MRHQQQCKSLCNLTVHGDWYLDFREFFLFFIFYFFHTKPEGSGSGPDPRFSFSLSLSLHRHCPLCVIANYCHPAASVSTCGRFFEYPLPTFNPSPLSKQWHDDMVRYFVGLHYECYWEAGRWWCLSYHLAASPILSLWRIQRGAGAKRLTIVNGASGGHQRMTRTSQYQSQSVPYNQLFILEGFIFIFIEKTKKTFIWF